MTSDSSELKSAVEYLEVMQPLRRGTLYRCRICGQPWHLNANGRWMSIVPEDRLPLIRAWDSAPIKLPDAVTTKLEEIGSTLADQYFGGEFVETPCGVVLHTGDRIDLAIVSIQQDAPVEEWRDYRLGSEIADVYPSPFALPLEVRRASAEANERAMGFAPSLIVMPDGQRFTLNGPTHFLTEPGYRAPEARICAEDIGFSELPPIASQQDAIHFVADC